MVHLTTRAIEHVKRIRDEGDSKGKALRVAVAPGGCSGFTYNMYFDDEKREDDAVFEFDDIRLFVDQLSLQYLDGTTIDFVQKSKYEAGFEFENPNVSAECGCGKSFSTN